MIQLQRSQTPETSRCCCCDGSHPAVNYLRPLLSPSSFVPHGTPPAAALSTAAWALASARFLTSPCLPFCCNAQQLVSHSFCVIFPPGPRATHHHIPTHRPLCKFEILLASALGRESILLLQAAAHDAGGDGEVAVVAAPERTSGIALVAGSVCLCRADCPFWPIRNHPNAQRIKKKKGGN